MARKPRKGYYVDGTFVVAGSEADTDDHSPSRTERKNASEELQDIGEKLVSLRLSAFAELALPENLYDAIADARRITAFGGRRRQLQLIGKLMRKLDTESLERVQEALRAEHGQSDKETKILHRAERWRDALVTNDENLKRWIEEFPGTDTQQLRALIRQVRKDANEAPPRRGQAYRQLFTFLRTQLVTSIDEAP